MLAMPTPTAKILIVDDDVDGAEMLAEFLQDEGYQVRIANDGDRGLTSVFADRPDLIILDVEMPVMPGPEMAYRVLVHDRGFEHVPILLCSGALELPSVAAAVGTPYYIAKPFGLAALSELVERALVERTAPNPRPPSDGRDGQPRRA